MNTTFQVLFSLLPPFTDVGQLVAAHKAAQKLSALDTPISMQQTGKQDTGTGLPRHAVALIRTASELSQKIMSVQSEMSSARLRYAVQGGLGQSSACIIV